jgi:hypothetical protein
VPALPIEQRPLKHNGSPALAGINRAGHGRGTSPFASALAMVDTPVEEGREEARVLTPDCASLHPARGPGYDVASDACAPADAASARSASGFGIAMML